MIIALLNQKGGVGKTTLATNIAAAIQRRNKSTILIDSDPQGSARDWSAAAENPSVTVLGMDRAQILQRDIKEVAKRYKYTVIDGSPQTRDMAIAGIVAADLVLIPVQPSPYDLWAAEDLIAMIKERQTLSGGQPKAAFVISRSIKNTNLAAEIMEVIQEFELPVLSGMTTQRQIYAKSASEGMSVFDMESDGPAAEEIDSIVDEVLAICR